MNKERFHNELAMRLGYERIVKDKRITIQVDDSYYDTYCPLSYSGVQIPHHQDQSRLVADLSERYCLE